MAPDSGDPTGAGPRITDPAITEPAITDPTVMESAMDTGSDAGEPGDRSDDGKFQLGPRHCAQLVSSWKWALCEDVGPGLQGQRRLALSRALS